MRVLLIVLLISAALSGPVGLRESAAGPAAYLVIAHPDVPASTVDRKFVADAFLKKVTRWPHDQAIHPVDLVPGAPARERFTQEILRRSVAAVKSYWQQQIFAGRDVPPPELDSDEQVVRYVLAHPGAIAYVSGSAHVAGARILELR